MVRRGPLTHLLLAVTLLVVACTNPGAGAGTGTGAGTSPSIESPDSGIAATPEPADAVAPAGAVATPVAKPGGASGAVGGGVGAPPARTPTPRPPREQAIRIPIAEPPTLDPGLATDNASLDVIAQLFEGLVEFDEQGVVYGLGAEDWDVSADGLTYTFTLREGAKWSDGQPVTAKDYEWAWKRNINPRTASDYAVMLYPIKNAVQIHKSGLDPSLLGVRARDDRTLIVTLEQPAAYFLRLASTWTLMPLRQDVVEKYGDRWTEAANIVGNGPFRLTEWQHDTQITLERSRTYWGDVPPLVRATYRIFPEGGGDQVLAAYEAGALDTLGAGTSFEIPAAQLARVLADPKLRQEVKTFAQSATMFIAVNHRREHLKDPRVRIALGQAIEREALLEQVLRRVGTPARSLHPEGILGREADLWPEQNLEEARTALADAGFPDGRGFPEITFTYNANAQWKPLAEYLQQRYKEALGITLKPEPKEWVQFLRWRRGEDWQNGGDLYRGGSFSDYEDPSNWFNVLWDSREDPATFNSGWKNDDYDRLVRRARGEPDDLKREELYRQAEQILAREYPHIPVFHLGLRTLVKPYVENFAPARVLGILSLKYVRLAEAP